MVAVVVLMIPIDQVYARNITAIIHINEQAVLEDDLGGDNAWGFSYSNSIMYNLCNLLKTEYCPLSNLNTTHIFYSLISSFMLLVEI